jgi:hypothetical protein
MVEEGLVVGEGELHPAYYGVEALGLGTAVLLVHQVGVVNYLGDLREYGILEIVLREERLEGAGVSVV